ncbi:class I SAM-dependent methyltransferase [Streptomyces viridochromogenes]|uniref:Putative methyltransferase type 11 n=1 Tax=Streptomyces viridochromogenes Tue57 TaxID=1160705 RepID=L8PQ77_STRVR|nr:class I SAM-dependent methyltransferase [Streptomyces viridochromogenes]ELS57582.1 putative methyltransferase type 11 [Streptomyces viridochromogenes Tue57]
MTAAHHPTVGDVFSAGADQFHRWSPLLWDPIGEATAAAAAPAPGERVLDACCGAGASALPAARAVGPEGTVDGVDLAGALLDIATDRARREKLDNVRFHRHDVTAWPAPDGGYDLVQCALGVFFFPDMDRDTTALTRLLRPGGRLAVTVWEKDALGDWRRALRAAVESERDWPDSPQSTRLARIETADGLAGWLAGLGLGDARVEQRRLDVPLSPATAWELVVGGRTRTLLDGLSPEAVERVRAAFTSRLDSASVTDLDVRILIGTAHT